VWEKQDMLKIFFNGKSYKSKLKLKEKYFIINKAKSTKVFYYKEELDKFYQYPNFILLHRKK